MEENLNVLIVDDDTSVIEILNSLLKKKYNISFSTNGQGALNLARSVNRPDLILLDVLMPDMDGFEVARILKKEARTRNIPIIFLTAVTEMQSIVEGLVIGGNDYITKPIQPEELLARINTHLELYMARKTIETANENLRIAVARKTSQIRKQNDELLILNKQLTRKKEKTESSDRLKTEFIAHISHEIRTPLNLIMGMAQLLGMDCDSMDADERNETIQSMMAGGEQLTRIIDLIMSIAQIKAGNYQLKVESIDINEVMNEVIERHTTEAQKKALSLQVALLPGRVMARYDRYCIINIFDHLLDNAIKFTEEGEISIRSERSGNGRIHMTIEDTGSGISLEYQENLFKIFSQEDQGVSRKFNGIGLGLALVKHCCDLNNVQIKVRSKKNSGTCFAIIFQESVPSVAA